MTDKTDFDKVEDGFELILEGLGLDLEDPHVKDTPRRAARAWFEELSAGITGDEPDITMFPQDGESGMVVLRQIPIRSLCSHHLLPFVGEAVVGYIPGNGKILGLSKLSRIANYWARRPQVQERLTRQIADDLWARVGGRQGNVEFKEIRDPETGEPVPSAELTYNQMSTPSGGVGVVIRARHMCMELRGVKHRSDMVTSELRGVFNEGRVRSEFMALARED